MIPQNDTIDWLSWWNGMAHGWKKSRRSDQARRLKILGTSIKIGREREDISIHRPGVGEGMKINIERTNLWPIKIPVLVRKGRWNVWTCHLIGRPSTPELLTKAVMVVVMWCGRDKLNEHWRMYLLPFSFRSHSTALLWPDRTTFPTAHYLPPLLLLNERWRLILEFRIVPIELWQSKWTKNV